MEVYHAYVDSPIGRVRIGGTERGITHVDFTEEKERTLVDLPVSFLHCVTQLQEYFEGSRTAFHSLPLVLRGTEFQLKVWEATSGVPFGETVQYGDIAKEIGHPDAVRAVGTALGRNSLCVLVPCHRVLPKGVNGGGYAWGMERKEWLLAHERAKTASK